MLLPKNPRKIKDETSNIMLGNFMLDTELEKAFWLNENLEVQELDPIIYRLG